MVDTDVVTVKIYGETVAQDPASQTGGPQRQRWARHATHRHPEQTFHTQLGHGYQQLTHLDKSWLAGTGWYR